MKCLFAAQMRSADMASIEMGIPAIVLMENAGRAVFEEVAKRWAKKDVEKVIIIAGKGNNGGDGFVAARHLWNSGYDVSVYLIGRTSEVKDHARVNLDIIIAMGLPITVVLDNTDLELLRNDLGCRKPYLCIDAIFGTGLSKEVKGINRSVIECINDSSIPVISVDIPSGLDADLGLPLGISVRASLTVTLAYPKVGLVLSSGVPYTGELVVKDISIPRAVEDSSWKVRLMKSEILENIPIRGPEAHKGDFGRISVFAGSPGFTGAACLACEAALRAGAGLVTLCVPAGLNPVMEMKLTEAMTRPLGGPDELYFSPSMIEQAIDNLKKSDAAIVGPGIGTSEKIPEFVQELIRNSDKPMVIDADALSILASNRKKLKIPAVLTPHSGEMARLIGWDIQSINRDRIGAARQCASLYNAVAVIKGFRSVIVSPDGRTAINPTGSNSMASGGMGDVLSGIIGAFLAQGLSPFNAACLGVYIHGLASDMVSETMARGQIASDLLIKIPQIVKAVK
jgi:ADP-dependent NAD(P)H-hydrate dehydratase / NAD(P)H-hydrate epimerase